MRFQRIILNKKLLIILLSFWSVLSVAQNNKNTENCNCKKWSNDYFVGYSNADSKNNCKSFCQELYYYLCLNQCDNTKKAWNHKETLMQKYQSYVKEYSCDCKALVGDYFVPEQIKSTGLSKIKRSSLDKFSTDFQQLQFPDYILPEEWESGGYSLSLYEANGGKFEVDALTAANITLAGINKSIEKGELDADAIIGGIKLLSIGGEKLASNIKLKKRRKEADFHSEMATKWDEYIKKENYELIFNSMLNEGIPEYEDFDEAHFYFFIVEKSKYQIAYSNVFELKTDKEGRYLTNTESLTRQIKAKGYNRVWLQGEYFDEASAKEFQSLMTEVFNANGIKNISTVSFSSNQSQNSNPKRTRQKITPSSIREKSTSTPKIEKEEVVEIKESKKNIKESQPTKIRAKKKEVVKVTAKPKPTIKEPEPKKASKQEELPSSKSKQKAVVKSTKKPAVKSQKSNKRKTNATTLQTVLSSNGFDQYGTITDEEIIKSFKDENENSILLFLLEKEEFSLAKKMIAKPAVQKIINNQNKEGLTALHLVCKKQNAKMLDYILYRNPDANIQDGKGWTPIHYAITSKDVKLVKLLKRHRANLSIKNNDGLNAIKFAKKYGTKEIVSLLKK